MIYYIIKVLVSAILIVAVAELAKRNTLMGAVIASIPLISVLAFIWLYLDTGDVSKISKLSMQIFWLVIPSLILFVSLPLLLKLNANFYIALTISIGLTAIGYSMLVWVLKGKTIGFFI